jgi:class 3 adenylate cyclase
VKTTGDGMLATFEGTADALECAAAIRDSAIKSDLHIRAGVHVGEVHMVGSDVRGTSVHLASRIMSKAGADEILASETTKVLASISSSHFEARGEYELKGFDGKHRLYAYTGGQSASAEP